MTVVERVAWYSSGVGLKDDWDDEGGNSAIRILSGRAGDGVTRVRRGETQGEG